MEAEFVTASDGEPDLDGPDTPTGAVPEAPSTADIAGTLARLFEQHAPGLVGALIAAGYPDAADSVQEAFVQAVVHWRRVGRYEDPVAWIRRVAVNKARNRSRSRRRQADVTERLGRNTSPEANTHQPPDDDVAAAVAALPQQQRLAVSLFYYCDLPVTQVAAAMGLREGTVKSHLHAARAAVARALEATP